MLRSALKVRERMRSWTPRATTVRRALDRGPCLLNARGLERADLFEGFIFFRATIRADAHGDPSRVASVASEQRS
jgi:hypothetical protein